MATGINTYVDFPGPGGFTFRVFLEETYDTTGNYSYTQVTGISVQAKTYNGTWYPGGTVSVAGAVVGTMSYNNPATHAFVVYSAGDDWIPLSKINSGAAFPWASAKIPHDADGSKTITVSINVTLWRSSGDPTFTITGSSSVELTTIPRASLVSGSNGMLGVSHKLSLTRYASAFTHTVKATCGEEQLTIKTGVQVDSVTWTPPMEWAYQNTTGTSVAVKITCTTYNGPTEIGSTSLSLVFAIPASVVPTARISVSDKKGYFSEYGVYVQGKSQAQISASGEGAYGSTISSYSVVCGTVTKTGDSPVFDLLTAGTIELTLKVTDSRGRTATDSVSITVAAYNLPSVAISSAYRCDVNGNEDSDGAYAIAVFSATVTPLNNRNSATYSLKYRVKGSTLWSSVAIPALSGEYAPSNASQIIAISADRGYELSVEVTDDFSQVLSAYRTVQVSFRLADFDRANKAIGFGQKATVANMTSFGMTALFNRGIKMSVVSVSSWDEIDAALDGIVTDMPNTSVDFRSFSINEVYWNCIIFKTSGVSATAEFFRNSGRRQKAMTSGAWGDVIIIR